ncbi:hypothetical protein BS50DRAFT_481117 [Corynespora cassiicola Philippines]|uniref:SAP domain-containing protein n=1 Tax=Corynespora cassiicola Philippines TaxID=1448308 RepID=A0A2T2P8H6_CORCC|nr:hypothetical protein BS50DRAFT_481117 [Corynespora cassiicola Philippines]
MADYSKQTVAKLRETLKERSIPSTGLTRKAQIIEKLEAWDIANNESEEAEEPAPEAQPDGDKDEEAEVANDAPTDAPAEETPAVAASEPTPPAAASEPTPAQEPSPPPASPPATVQPADQEQEVDAMEVEANTPQPEPQRAPSPPAAEKHVPPQEPESADAPTDAHAQTNPQQGEAQSDVAMEDNTPSPDPNEKPSVEKPELAPIPEQSTTTTAEASRLNSEERELDKKKRKRRSVSPDLSTQDVTKRQRLSPEPAPEMHLKDDADVVMEQTEESHDGGANGVDKGKEKAEETGNRRSESPLPETKRSPKKEKARGFKELFNTDAPEASNDALPDDRPIAPAMHVATPAIYIRDFMRPLRPDTLRKHLVSIASPPSGGPDEGIVKNLFLDWMRTHALVLFANTAAASRARTSLHGTVWPPEGNRKALWADFVPEDQVLNWIQEEEDAAGGSGRPGRSTKRFEVVYQDAQDGSGAMEAIFQEVGANPPAYASGASNAPFNAPRGPRSDVEQRRPPHQQAPPPDTAAKDTATAAFAKIDELFLSTNTKPKIYYKPVSQERIEARKRNMDAATARDWAPEARVRGRGAGGRADQLMRYSFDEQDRVVDAGFDHGPWAAERGGFRGGRGGYRGRGGRGGRGHWRG